MCVLMACLIHVLPGIDRHGLERGVVWRWNHRSAQLLHMLCRISINASASAPAPTAKGKKGKQQEAGTLHRVREANKQLPSGPVSAATLPSVSPDPGLACSSSCALSCIQYLTLHPAPSLHPLSLLLSCFLPSLPPLLPLPLPRSPSASFPPPPLQKADLSPLPLPLCLPMPAPSPFAQSCI